MLKLNANNKIFKKTLDDLFATNLKVSKIPEIKIWFKDFAASIVIDLSSRQELNAINSLFSFSSSTDFSFTPALLKESFFNRYFDEVKDFLEREELNTDYDFFEEHKPYILYYFLTKKIFEPNFVGSKDKFKFITEEGDEFFFLSRVISLFELRGEFLTKIANNEATYLKYSSKITESDYENYEFPWFVDIDRFNFEHVNSASYFIIRKQTEAMRYPEHYYAYTQRVIDDRNYLPYQFFLYLKNLLFEDRN